MRLALDYPWISGFILAAHPVLFFSSGGVQAERWFTLPRCTVGGLKQSLL